MFRDIFNDFSSAKLQNFHETPDSDSEKVSWYTNFFVPDAESIESAGTWYAGAAGAAGAVGRWGSGGGGADYNCFKFRDYWSKCEISPTPTHIYIYVY